MYEESPVDDKLSCGWTWGAKRGMLNTQESKVTTDLDIKPSSEYNHLGD